MKSMPSSKPRPSGDPRSGTCFPTATMPSSRRSSTSSRSESRRSGTSTAPSARRSASETETRSSSAPATRSGSRGQPEQALSEEKSRRLAPPASSVLTGARTPLERVYTGVLGDLRHREARSPLGAADQREAGEHQRDPEQLADVDELVRARPRQAGGERDDDGAPADPDVRPDSPAAQ